MNRALASARLCSLKHYLNLNQFRSIRIHQEKTLRLMYHRKSSFDAIDFGERKRDAWIDWNYHSELYAFAKRLNESVTIEKLMTIFSSQSYVDKLKRDEERLKIPQGFQQVTSNKLLATKGKNLLDLYIKEYLRYAFKKLPEDGIEAINEYLTSTQTLADIAKWIGCKDLIQTSEFPPSQATMAESVEAFIAGLEEESGSERTRRFVIDMIVSYIHDKDLLDDIWKLPHPCETVNLILENSKLPHYEPRIMFQVGPKSLDSCFHIGLYVDKKLIGSGSGETCEIAEQCAALRTLQNFFDIAENREPLRFGIHLEGIDFSSYGKKHKFISEWTK